AGEGELEKALVQVDFALEYEPNHAEARLLRGQILIAQKHFAEGRAELEQYLKQRPKDADARKLADLCEGKSDDPTVLFAIAEVFQRQMLFALARSLLDDVSRQVEARKPLLELYRKQIEAAWLGLGTGLTLEPDGQFQLGLGAKQVTTLEPLRGMQLN